MRAFPTSFVQICLIVVVSATITLGQSVAPALLLDPPADSWLTYHGDYSGQRHSPLTQITPDNVNRLTQA